MSGGDSAVLRVIPGREMPDDVRRRIVALCDAAFEEPTGELFATMDPVSHVVCVEGDEIVSHAMWVDRRLQAGDREPIRTAYVEFVATRPEHQGRGLGTAVMERIVEEMRGRYRLAALCTGSPAFYRRLGWRVWGGPLSVRQPSGRIDPSAEEGVMVLEIDSALALDRFAPLSVEWREGEVW